jgi:hypothetical protein
MASTRSKNDVTEPPKRISYGSASIAGRDYMERKPQLSEQNAAEHFLGDMFNAVKSEWPRISEEISRIFEDNTSSLETTRAPFEFCLAVIATEIQALPNLFQPKQATRIQSHIINHLTSLSDLKELIAGAMTAYQTAWDEYGRRREPPWYGIASVLYDRLGCTANISIGSRNYKSPTSLQILALTVTTCGGGWWKELTSRYEIIP